MTYINQVGQEMINDSTFKTVFPNTPRPRASRTQMTQIKEHLESFGIPCPKPPSPRVVDLELELPSLLGENIEEHFEEISSMVLGDAEKRLIEHLKGVPDPPTEFDANPGWTRYVEGELPMRVKKPLEKTYTYDCETLVKRGNWPCMMAAVSTKAWYIWLHPSVCVPAMIDFARKMVPFGTDKNFVGHNVGFDRVRLADEYSLLDTGNRFFDTMSWHTAVAGLGSEMRKTYAAMAYKPEHVQQAIGWFSKGSPKNLVDCYNFHVHRVYGPYKGFSKGLRAPMRKEAKEIRDIFVEASGPDIIHNRLHELVTYMVTDVHKTWQLAAVLFHKFRRTNPSKATLAATTLMGSSLLPVTNDWEKWKHTCESVYHETQRAMEAKLLRLATELHSQWLEETSHYDLKALSKPDEWASMDWLKGTSFESNPWLKNLDWTPAKSGRTKGQAAWWRKSKKKFTSRGRITPYLLGLSWSERPIFHTKKYGWVFQVESKNEAGGYKVLQHGDIKVCRVPHKKGGDNNCGNPLAKDYISSYESGAMTASQPAAEEILKDAATISYWTSVGSRVHSQFALEAENPHGENALVIVPQLEVMGTATRRSVERLWLTTCSTKPNKVGSELKARIQAPDGWTFVAADFDAQETMAGCRLGDSQVGLIGGTAMAYTTVSGSKDAGTDGHSQLRDYLNEKLAAIRKVPVEHLKDGIKRDESKGPGFAMLYGSGKKGLAATFKTVRKEWTDKECKTLAESALELRKGKRVFGAFGEMYHGGTDSDAFNYMLKTANQSVPKTPMFKSQITSALRKSAVGSDFMTSRTNWVIQSSGQDLTHAAVVGFKYLCMVNQIPARYLFQYHDEILVMCPQGYEKRTAQALNIAHLWAQAMMSYSLGLDDVSANSAFFSGTNIDTCFRKEVYQSQMSISWPHEIEPGECLRPEEVFEGGCLLV